MLIKKMDMDVGGNAVGVKHKIYQIRRRKNNTILVLKVRNSCLFYLVCHWSLDMKKIIV